MKFNNRNIPDLLGKDYQLHLNSEKVKSTRIMCTLGIFLYLIFIVVDFYALPSALYEAFVIRAVVIAGLGFLLASTFSVYFTKFYQFLQLVPYGLAGVGINMMIYISESSDKASEIYFAGLILVIMVLFSWTYLRLAYLFITTSLLVAMYVYIEVSKHAELSFVLSTLISNCFFLVSAAVIGLAIQVNRNQYLRQNFLLQQSLQEAFEKKSIEAKDNEYLANHDSLTDLPNRRYMMELLEQSLQIANANDKVLVIMFVDLNGFKNVNDVYGHSAGDEVLVIAAKRLELAIRQGDHLSRLGGDEFLMGLMMDKENLDEVESMASKFIDIISQAMNVEGLRVKVSASIGVAAYPIHGNNISSLIEIADKRMYEAKKHKKHWNLKPDSVQDFDDKSVVVFPSRTER